MSEIKDNDVTNRIPKILNDYAEYWRQNKIFY